MTNRRPRAALPVLPANPVSSPANATAPLPGGTRIGVLTLGCDKNTVDTERLLGRLASAGADVSTSLDDAEVIVVNTCGFIETAKEESIEAILEAVRMKESGQTRAVVAMGCLVQRYKNELAEELPEVDLFLGLTEAEQLVPALRAKGILDATAPANMAVPRRLLSTATRHTSHLKISEGCDHTCAFCAIPLMRGKHRSTPIDVLVAEAQDLEKSGVVELNLISQDTTWYGRDLARGIVSDATDFFVGQQFRGMPNVDEGSIVQARATGARDVANRHGLLPELLRTLLRETSIPWFRLFYMYPSGIQRELVELIAAEPRLLPYLDMPIQHGSDNVLARMRRPERQATIRERAGWLRDAIPDLALRTTVIVGFPGETEDDFRQMLELLEEIRFDHVGAFTYSVEEQTAAADMPDQVPDEVKLERLEQLFELQRSIGLERNEARVGSIEEVLIDRITGRDSDVDGINSTERGAVGRTRHQAIEVDGLVHLRDAGTFEPGDFIRVEIVGALEDDLIGEVLGRGS